MEQIDLGSTGERGEERRLGLVAGDGVPAQRGALGQHLSEHGQILSLGDARRGEAHGDAPGRRSDLADGTTRGAQGRPVGGTDLDGHGRSHTGDQPGQEGREQETGGVHPPDRLESQDLAHAGVAGGDGRTRRSGERAVAGRRLCSAGHALEGFREIIWRKLSF